MKKNLLTKIRNRKGFTLAELLIVVAIIGVLVAISIPIFTSQLTKARRATNQANARAAYAAAAAAYLTDDSIKGGTYDIKTGKFTTATAAPKELDAKDYGASGAIESFNVIITEGTGTTDSTISVTPKDSGAGATYNKSK
jgi:prepilin-type N-terminal cleavage/methylation domain-containing protein